LINFDASFDVFFFSAFFFALNAKEDPSKFFLEDGGAGIMGMLQASAMVGSQNGGGGSPIASKTGLNIQPPTIKPGI